jgi:hypothetical protein
LGEIRNGTGKLAEASEEGQGPRRAVEPMMMIMMIKLRGVGLVRLAECTRMEKYTFFQNI